MLLPIKGAKASRRGITWCLIIYSIISQKSSSFIIQYKAYKSSLFHQTHTRKIHQSSLNNDVKDGYYVDVTYENRKSKIFVQKEESILSALENAKISKTLCVSTLPFECRRGNCLTCVGKITGEDKSVIRQEEDGLEPNLSQEIRDSGYVMTCSTFVVGDGLKIELGLKDEVWDYVYRGRIVDSQQIRRNVSFSLIFV